MTRRVFEQQRLWRLTAEGFQAAAALIAAAERRRDPHMVVGIDRGGRPLAELLGRLLGLPVVAVRARHNDTDAVEVAATGRVRVNSDAARQVPAGRRLLVVDDVCGSGATLRTVGAVLTGLCRPSLLRSAVLCCNIGAAVRPDTWVWEVADWTCFPWEAGPGRHTEALPRPDRVRQVRT